jgi:hypothetical protein
VRLKIGEWRCGEQQSSRDSKEVASNEKPMILDFNIISDV